jgi:hypothetical protein
VSGHRRLGAIRPPAGITGGSIGRTIRCRLRRSIVLRRSLGMRRAIGVLRRSILRAIAGPLDALLRWPNRRAIRGSIRRAIRCGGRGAVRRRPLRLSIHRGGRGSRSLGRAIRRPLGRSLDVLGTRRLLDVFLPLRLSLGALCSLHTFSTLASFGRPFV